MGYAANEDGGDDEGGWGVVKGSGESRRVKIFKVEVSLQCVARCHCVRGGKKLIARKKSGNKYSLFEKVEGGFWGGGKGRRQSGCFPFGLRACC